MFYTQVQTSIKVQRRADEPEQPRRPLPLDLRATKLRVRWQRRKKTGAVRADRRLAAGGGQGEKFQNSNGQDELRRQAAATPGNGEIAGIVHRLILSSWVVRSA